MLNDTLANALCCIQNAEKVGKKGCIVRKISRVTKSVFEIMQKEGYLGEVEYIDDKKGGIAKVTLRGRINKTGTIKPRFSVKKENFEKYEKRFLPARNFGIIIVSTSKGIMTHEKAKEKEIGGRLISYVY